MENDAEFPFLLLLWESFQLTLADLTRESNSAIRENGFLKAGGNGTRV
jgi:hypothetical protein